MAHYYEPSGRFSPLSFLLFIAVSAVLLPILGLIYAYAIWYIPFIYINFLITAGFGFATGFLIARIVIRYGKVRNRMLAILFGVLAGFASLYFQWAVWIDLAVNISDTVGTDRIGVNVSKVDFLQVYYLVFHPSEMFQIMGEINKVGLWGLFGGTVNGIFLSIVWIIEALIVLVLSVMLPLGVYKIPFCEFSNSWFNSYVLPPFKFIANPSALATALKDGQEDSVAYFKRAERADFDHSLVTIYSSEDENYLSVTNRKLDVKSKENNDFKDFDIIDLISVSKEMVKELQEIKFEG